MEKQIIKTPKRDKPTQIHSKSKQKDSSSQKRRKKSINIEETKQQKLTTKNTLQIECFICAQPYNLNRKVPVVACPNNHTFCLHCITLSIDANKTNCPMCRSLMQPTQLNSTIYEQVLASYKEKNKHVESAMIERKLIKLSIKKFSKKYSSLDDVEIVPRSGKILKKNQNKVPSLLVFEPQIKENQIRTYQFIYIPSNKVQISFGICVYDKFLMKMIQNCGFDTKIIDYFMKKKDPLIKVNLKRGLKIVVNVDMNKNQIHWFSQKQHSKNKKQEQLYLISSQPIEVSKKVGDLAFYPYCVLYNVGDTVELNK